jgi:uncharacterized protein (TIRG00374 family)
VRLLVASTLTAIVLWRANPGAVLRAGQHADFGWIALAIALVIADRALMAYRWLVLLRPIDTAALPPFAAIMRVFFVSTFVGTFLPASIGGDAVRAYALARLNVPAAPAVASVLMDRLLGVLSIVIVGLAGLFIGRSENLAANRTIELSFVVALLVCIAGALVVFNERMAGLAQAIAARMPFAPLRRIAVELGQATRAYGRYHGALANVLTGSIGVQILRVLQAFCLGRALALVAPLAIYFAFIPLILLIMLLPVSINGIGTSQVAFVWFFTRASATEAEAFALSVLFLALGIVGNLPGGFLYAFRPQPIDR